MGRRRREKKLRKRRDELTHCLEKRYLEEDDEGFLALASEHPEALQRPEVAPLAAEVADRLLRRALGRGDCDQLASLLSRLGAWGRQRPLGTLAAAVLHLAAGRLPAAQELLATFASAGDAGLSAAGFTALQTLAAPASGEEEAEAEKAMEKGEANEAMAAFSQLRTQLAVLNAPERKNLPRSSGLEPPWADALWGFVRALSRFARRGGKPTPAVLKEISAATAALRTALPADQPLAALLDEADAYLDLLRALGAIERRLEDRRRTATAPGAAVARQLRALSPTLRARLGDGDSPPPPDLLAPLAQSTEQLWHRLLTRIATQEGAARLAALYTAWPRVFEPWLCFAAGSGKALVRYQENLVLQMLFRSGRHQELARRLALQAKDETSADRLAVLWSLELCCMRWADDEEEEDDETSWFDEPEDDRHAVTMRLTLRRLASMSTAIGHRFPAAQRAGVGRYLRDALLDLCANVFFDASMQAVAEALLAHLPDDPELMLVALAGAVCGHDGQAHRSLATRIAQSDARLDLDRESTDELLLTITDEPPRFAATIFAAAQPLFSPAQWDRALDLVAERLAERLCIDLEMAPGLSADEHMEMEVKRTLRETPVDAFRSLLAGRAAYETMVLLVGLLEGRRRHSVEEQVAAHLQRFPALRDALRLLRLLTQIPEDVSDLVPRDVMGTLMNTIIDRIDADFRTWLSDLPMVVLWLVPKQERRLRGKLTRMLRNRGLDDETRRKLIEARILFDEVREEKRRLLRSKNVFGLPWTPAPPTQDEETPRRPRRRAGASNERQLPLELS